MHGSQYVTNQSMHESKYVTNTPTWEGCWLQSSSVHLHDEDQEAPWSQNPTAYKCNSIFKRKMKQGKLSPVIICLQQQVQQPYDGP